LPSVIHEQNAVLGRVNRLLSGRVDAIATSYAKVDRLKPRHAAKLHLTGNPVRPEVLALREDNARLGRALDQLPQKQRELIERAFFGERSHSEIAAETGLPLGTIKSRIRLALDRLRHELSDRR
jgi:RNA polymerase sigma factor (sigma-70 family)